VSAEPYTTVMTPRASSVTIVALPLNLPPLLCHRETSNATSVTNAALPLNLPPLLWHQAKCMRAVAVQTKQTALGILWALCSVLVATRLLDVDDSWVTRHRLPSRSHELCEFRLNSLFLNVRVSFRPKLLGTSPWKRRQNTIIDVIIARMFLVLKDTF
jgi:hypothetical protein